MKLGRIGHIDHEDAGPQGREVAKVGVDRHIGRDRIVTLGGSRGVGLAEFTRGPQARQQAIAGRPILGERVEGRQRCRGIVACLFDRIVITVAGGLRLLLAQVQSASPGPRASQDQNDPEQQRRPVTD